MLLEALVLGVIVGVLRGGSLRHLGSLPFRYASLIIGAFLLQILTFLSIELTSQIRPYGFYIFLFTYLLLLLAIGFNFKNPFFKIMGLGVFLNFLVILLNGGMPALGFNSKMTSPLHTALDNHTKLKFLADIIPLRKPYPFPGFVSIGDILLSLGVFLLVQEAMVYKGKRASKKTREEG